MPVSPSINSPFTFDNTTIVCETVPPDVHAAYPVPLTAFGVELVEVAASNNSKVVAVGFLQYE